MPVRNKLKNENKIMLQLLSVFIAVVLWLIIGYTEDPVIDVTLSNIKVEYRGLELLEEKGLTIPNANKNPALTFAASGKRSELISTIRNATAYVDVSQLSEADTYTLDVRIDMPTDAVRISKQKFKVLDVVVEPILTKDVPIVVRQIDKHKEYLIKSTPQQDSVKLIGSQSLLENVSCVMVAVSTIDMKEDNIQKYSYRIMDSNNSEVDDKDSFKTDTDSIMVYNELYKPKLMNVDISIPESVSAVYDVDILQTLTVTAGVKENAPEKLTAEFPENAITAPGAGDFSVILHTAENVYIESESKEPTVRAVVTKKELQYVQIPVRFKNVGSEYNAWCETPAVDTYINCVPSKLSPANLVAYADMKGMGAGVHEISLTFEHSNDVKIIGEYKVNVTLTRKNN